MRDTQGLVDSLVSYIEQEETPDDKVALTWRPAPSSDRNTLFRGLL